MNCRKTLLGIFFLFFAGGIFAQTEHPVPASFDGLSWEIFVEKCEAELNVRFFYKNEIIPEGTKISVKKDSQGLQKVLDLNLNRELLFASIDRGRNVFVRRLRPVATELPKGFFDALDSLAQAKNNQGGNSGEFLETKKEYFGTAQIIGSKENGIGERRTVVSGYITDSRDGTPILGATVFIPETGDGTASDETGFYTLTLKKKKYAVVIRNLNYEELKFEMDVLSSGKLDIPLKSQEFTLEGVTVTSSRDDNVKGMQMGFEKLSTKAISSIPSVMGERDILKVAVLLPGVQSAGEGSGGFNVRGSPADHNLFYIEDIPVYNTSHLLGFFSTFNSDVIKDFSILKSNMPAEFGGRLSSVFDVTAKQGNKKEFSARGGISPITGKIMAEGPIKKNKSSFLVGVRSTYSDWMLNLVENQDVKNSSAQFADAVAHLNFDLSEDQKFRVFAYYSFDDLDYAGRTQFGYQNLGVSANWRKIISKKHSLDVTGVHYNYATDSRDNELPIAGIRLKNDLLHDELKTKFTFRPKNNHTVTFGANSILYNVHRGDLTPASNSSLIIPKDLGRERGLESGVFINEEWDISPRFSVMGGLRYNIFNALGGEEVYEYAEGEAKVEKNVTNTLNFSNYQVSKTYSGLDYRAAAKYLINDRFSVKGSFNRMHQYIFLLTNTVSLSPTDKWKLIDPNIEPMVGDQVSGGIYTKLFNKRIEFSAEGYYKKVQNLIEYRDGADLVINEVPEWDLLQGDLDAYGFEFMLKKPGGKFNGWFNYTYSNTSVLVNSLDPNQRINSGNPYPSNYDKPHYFNLVSSYQFTRRLSMSLNFVYSTGRPITYPAGSYFQDQNQFIHYSTRNEFRIPDYLRMDFSVKLEGNLSTKKKIHGTWVFSIYNLAGRDNAYSVYFKNEDRAIRGYKLAIFGAPIFSATYNFKMGHIE